MERFDINNTIISPTNIREFRLANNLSQKELATQLEQHTSCVSGWELGKWGPTKSAIPKLTKMIVEWQTKVAHQEIDTKETKSELRQLKSELNRYKTLCRQQEQLINTMLEMKGENGPNSTN